MSKVAPLAFVIDRATAPRVAADVRGLGGAWREMFDLWQRLDGEYLVLLAHTRERITRRAPLTVMCLDHDHLRHCLREACARVDGIQVKWYLFCGPETETIVREELLLDSQVEGSA